MFDSPVLKHKVDWEHCWSHKVALIHTRALNICVRTSYAEILSFVLKSQGGDSQNFLPKYARFFVTFDLKILGLFRLKVLFEADIIKG